jgi:chromatin segregation and condensation protein Rec8/ScpA/Scc1 (kleisin family)
MVGLFLALLELVRQHRVRVRQDAERAAEPGAMPGDDIVINLRPPDDDEDVDVEHVREAPIDEVIEEVTAENIAASLAARDWEDDHIFGDEDEPDEDDDELASI